MTAQPVDILHHASNKMNNGEFISKLFSRSTSKLMNTSTLFQGFFNCDAFTNLANTPPPRSIFCSKAFTIFQK